MTVRPQIIWEAVHVAINVGDVQLDDEHEYMDIVSPEARWLVSTKDTDTVSALAGLTIHVH